jgi:predicted dehydrogenase
MSLAQQIQLVTLDPGHFHAALIQKTMYDEVDPMVHVYAPEGNDVLFHLDRIKAYNTRANDPTNWKQVVYTGNDFFEKMLNDKAGNVVVISGNNQKKTEYILKSLEAGFNVFADKPMAIDKNDFEMLKQAFAIAEKNNLLLYDIMTERFEITTILQKQFSLLPEVFGNLKNGSPEKPAITKESVHHLYKFVSGNVLTRPDWFLDVSQEGEGIVDVMTHLVDLVQWECFPGQIIDYSKDININSAKHWPTEMTLEEFKDITKLDSFPDFLKKYIVDNTLYIYCNGEINYNIKGVHAKTSVTWAYKAPAGTGDTHYSIMKGSRANLIIRQGPEENFKPNLYIEPLNDDDSYENLLMKNLKAIQGKYPGIELKRINNGWQVVIPEKYKEGHEAHFASVTKKFLEYLTNKNIPEWEIPNMISKYYTTTKALEIANQ